MKFQYLSRRLVLNLSILCGVVMLCSCAARESHRALEPQRISSDKTAHMPPAKVAIGEFANRSTYMTGIFAGPDDRLGKQAEQILTTHLTQSRAFSVVDRRNLEALAREAKYSGTHQAISGASVVITGAVTEFGRKETGTRSLGGLIHKTKTQTLYTKVTLSLVDAGSSTVVGSYQGAGEYMLTNKEVLGFGGRAGYDSTLADKVLNLAIMEAIERMVEARARGEW